ncbi:MAG: signal peptide peptidase SppA [Planctomycetes bacterium]|nr:signal peptide peptidase SppA [Planctomycetota bacterium]MDE1888992.1 signal peptide peptidase SppA [Planctomycetota bacterium]
MKGNFFYTLFISIFSLCLLCLLGLGCSFISISLIPPVEPLKETTVSGSGKDKILIIDISGIISEEGKSSLAGLSGEPDIVARIREELKLAAKDKHIKAIILRINSPGGTVTAADIMYHEIEQFKEKTGIKVIACIMDLGASGGYYVAVSADKIVAHPTTVTGSIGVIMLNLSFEGLLQKIGVKDTSIKTGEYKDMGSPLKTMTDEERKIFQSVMNNLYERFLSVIAKNRKELTPEKIRSLADGRIYTAQQALELKLIDQIGYLDETIAQAKKDVGIEEARVVIYHRPGTYKNNIYSQLSSSSFGAINLLNIDLKTFVRSGTPSFMYLWTP